MAQVDHKAALQNSRAFREAMEIFRSNDRSNPLWSMAVLLLFGVASAREFGQ